jgi:type IV secretory pathway VirB3-like protein
VEHMQSYRFMVNIYRGTSVLLRGVSSISSVVPVCSICVMQTTVVFIVTDFILYICLAGVFHTI